MTSSFELGDRYDALVRELVASGRYRDASDVVRAGLQMLEDRETDLRARRVELEASFEEALTDAGTGNVLTSDEVRAHLDRLHKEAKRTRAAAE